AVARAPRAARARGSARRGPAGPRRRWGSSCAWYEKGSSTLPGRNGRTPNGTSTGKCRFGGRAGPAYGGLGEGKAATRYAGRRRVNLSREMPRADGIPAARVVLARVGSVECHREPDDGDDRGEDDDFHRLDPFGSASGMEALPHYRHPGGEPQWSYPHHRWVLAGVLRRGRPRSGTESRA